MKQTSFASLSFASKKKKTRKELFLEQMQACVPWPQFEAVIEPYYPKSGRRGGQPIGITTMLRIYLMQQWFNLSDPMMEDALYEVESMRRFAGLELCEDRIPDETTILKFRHLLEKHALTERLFEAVNAHLLSRGLQVSRGTMVDATLIAASPSTKNAKGERDPEMHQTRKGKQWYFGMKIHIGADVDSGAAHTVTVTAANEADINQLPKLLRASDQVIFGDAGYSSDEYKRGARALGIHWKVNDKRKPGHGDLSRKQRKRNRQQSSIRARIEHLFRIIKCQFGYRRVRYKGLEKNRAQVMSLMVLANLYLLRGRLAA
ncbi:MAG: IS5 family transposase [Rhodobacterales bacterium]|nr:IS5 family transposase [Rhodobacterales bacterium]MBD3777599.1 IS5 family transposase [Thiotrichales bacterium]